MHELWHVAVISVTIVFMTRVEVDIPEGKCTTATLTMLIIVPPSKLML